MDGTFVWILVFAGATIGLLATFLIASERELKKKRAEIEALKNTASDAAATSGEHRGSAEVSGELSDLQSKNQELARELNRVSGKLAESENRAAELESAMQRLRDAETDKLELQRINRELTEQVAELSGRVERRESELVQLENDRSQKSDREVVLDQEIESLANQLKDSHARIRALESAGERLVSAESRATELMAQRQEFENRIEELERCLLAEREKLVELEGTHGRLRDVENAYREALKDAKYFQQELARCQERIAENQDAEQRLATLRGRLEPLHARVAAVGESQRQFETELSAIAQLLDLPANRPEDESAAQSAGHVDVNEPARDEPQTLPAPLLASSEESTGHRGQAPVHNKSRYRSGVAIVALLLLGAVVAARFLSSGSVENGVSALPAGAPVVNVANVAEPFSSPVTDQEKQPNEFQPRYDQAHPTAAEPSGSAPAAPLGLRRSAVKAPAATAKDSSSTGRAVSAGAIYEIVRPAQVFSEPGENSQLIANIDPGMQVNVVSARNGWLEIRSKHGRPPGYIKQEAAVRTRPR